MEEPGPIGTDRHAPAGWRNGTDPAGWADVDGASDPFPPPLHLHVRPADGSWFDAALLGPVEDGLAETTAPPDALLADLAAAAGDPDADWATLHESDDPAVRALALRWRP